MEISIDDTEEKIKILDLNIKEIEEIKSYMENNNIRLKTKCLSAHRKFALGSMSK